MSYQINTDFHTGTLDELLEKLKKGQIDPLTVDLRTVIEGIKKAEAESPKDKLEFAEALVTLSSLLVGKSKAMLPLDKDEKEDDTATPEEIRANFARYEKLTEYLDSLEDQNAQSFTRQATVKIEEELDTPLEEYLGDVTTDDLTAALRNVLQRFRKDQAEIDFKEEVEPEPFTVGEKIEELRGRLKGLKKKIEFTQLFGQVRSRLEIIVTFLAMLELIKQREVKVYQERRFGPILLGK